MRCSCGKFIKFSYTKEGEEFKSLYERALNFLMDETNDGCCRESAKEFILHYIDYLIVDCPRFYDGRLWDLVPKEEIANGRKITYMCSEEKGCGGHDGTRTMLKKKVK